MVPLVLCVLCVSAVNFPLPAAEPTTPVQDAVDPDVLRKVRKLINDTLSTENEAREAAWKGLKEMSNLAVPGLVALNRQKDTTPDMQRSIVIALGDTKDPRAGPALVELLASKDGRLRRDAARSLGDSGYRDAVPALEKLAGTAAEPEDVRLHAAVAAARMESAEALKVLAELAKSPQADTRSRAIFALGKYGGVKQTSVIAQALTDADRDVREDAVAALRHIEKKDAWGPLVQATADSDYKVRAAAMDALREITGEKIGNDSAAWKAWWAEQKNKPAP